MIQFIDADELPFVSAADNLEVYFFFSNGDLVLNETAVKLTGSNTAVNIDGVVRVNGSEPGVHLDGSGSFLVFSEGLFVEGTAVLLTGTHTEGILEGSINGEILLDARGLSNGVSVTLINDLFQPSVGDIFLSDYDDSFRIDRITNIGPETIFFGDVNGGDGDDALIGSGLSGIGDVMRGQDGNDLIRVLAGQDRASGGAGDDELYGGGGRDRLYGGTGQDELFGGAGRDALFGRSGDDLINGGSDDDRLGGSTGDDVLVGESGRDVLVGHAGHDTLEGGSGEDRFVFRDDDGVWTDTILDFQHGADAIRFENGVVAGRNDLTITPVGGDVQIAYSDDFILVLDTNIDDFVTSDFLFR